MPADLRVSAIALPLPLHAPCPTSVVVTVTNDGDEPPRYGRQRSFDVAVDISGSVDAPFSPRFQAKVYDPERSNLQPGQSMDVTVDVSFPCLAQAWVRADANPARTILNDVHSQPPFAVVANPKLVPSLVASLRAGQDGSRGPRFQDEIVCPDRDLLVEATLTNQGCAQSPATSLVVSLEDPSGTVIDSQTFAIGAPAPGRFGQVVWTVRTPKLAAVPSRMLVVRACGDPNRVVVDQCDRATLCATVVKSVDAGTPTRVSLFASVVTTPPTLVFPSQVPKLQVRLQNGCADIGAFTWSLQYGKPPTTIATGKGVVFPRESWSEVIDPAKITIPPAIANSFWTIGKQTVTIEIIGTGADPGPYRASYDFDVSPEKVDSTWWTWTASFPTPLWNATYTVAGFIANKGLNPMTVTAFDFTEHPKNVPDETTDVVTTLSASALPAAPIAPLFGSVAFANSYFHNWIWMSRVFFVRTGPTEVTYDMTVHFTLIDAFGNSYGPIASSVSSVKVFVPTAKLLAQEFATVLTTIGAVLVASGIVCFMTVPAPYDLLCLIPLAAGMTMVISGTLRGEDAFDPPIPDFSQGSEEAAPAEWQLPCADGDPAAAAFIALTLDLRRIDAAARAAARSRDRAYAADIDGDCDRLAQRQRECRDALNRLERAVHALAPIVDEMYSRTKDGSHSRWMRIPKSAKLLSGEELVKKVREHTKDLKASKEEMKRVEEVLKATTDKQMAAAVESLRSGGLREIPPLAERWFEAVRDEYAALPFLRRVPKPS